MLFISMSTTTIKTRHTDNNSNHMLLKKAQMQLLVEHLHTVMLILVYHTKVGV